MLNSDSLATEVAFMVCKAFSNNLRFGVSSPRPSYVFRSLFTLGLIFVRDLVFVLFVWADLLVGPYACFLHDIVMMMSNFDTLNVYGKYCKRRIFREAQF